jgi:type I restriction enzyme M protein
MAPASSTTTRSQGKHREPHAEREEYDAVAEFRSAVGPYEKDRRSLLVDLAKFAKAIEDQRPSTIRTQHKDRKTFNALAERIKGLIKQIDLLAKLAALAHDQIGKIVAGLSDGEKESSPYDRRSMARLLKQLEEDRHSAVEQLRRSAYFHRQVVWLQDRFPDAELQPVAGLVKLVDRKEIEAADWCLTPGRYVGVAPPELDEDFDFEQTIRDIHTELADLNMEATVLGATIQENFEELGIGSGRRKDLTSLVP